MSTTTALQLIQQAAGEIGLAVPTVAVGNTNAEVVQLLALLNAVGYELLGDRDWQALCKVHTFSTGALTQFALPADYDRQVDDTHWEQGAHWKLRGPVTAQQWALLTNGMITSGPRPVYRIFGGFFQIWPAQSPSQTLGFEYVSKAWAASASAVAKNSITVDTDTCIYPDRLMVLGLKSQHAKAKGLPDVYRSDYLAQLSLAKSNDAGSPTLSFFPTIPNVLIGWDQIPDSNYGS